MRSEGQCAAGTIVLVADDETLVRLVVHDALSEAGYRVLEARDGQEALAILNVHKHIRALVTDVNMPSIDGLSLAKIVVERWPNIGIVIASAMPLPEAPPAGARFVSKPYKLVQLLEEVELVIASNETEPAAMAIDLRSIPNLRPGQMHSAGGLATPLLEQNE